MRRSSRWDRRTHTDDLDKRAFLQLRKLLELRVVKRVIPLTPYVHHLIAALPKRGEWVFAGAGDDALTRPAKNLATACTVAGVDHVSLHGLRRSFKSLTEWLEVSGNYCRWQRQQSAIEAGLQKR